MARIIYIPWSKGWKSYEGLSMWNYLNGIGIVAIELIKEELFLVDICWKKPNRPWNDLLSTELLLEVAHKHKLMPTVLAFLDRNNIEYNLDVKHKKIIQRFQEERSFWISVLQILDSESEILKDDFYILKGFVFEQFYPEGAPRFSTDMDVLLRNEQSFWRVIDTLRKNEITMPGMFQLFRSFMDGKLEGISRICIPDGRIDGGLELHLRRFQTTQRTWIHVNQLDLTNSNNSLKIGGIEVNSLSHADNLIIFLYEMLTRDNLCIRDYYDAYCLASEHLIGDAKDYIKKKIHTFGLEASLKRINQGFLLIGIDPPAIYQDAIIKDLGANFLSPLSFHEGTFFKGMSFLKSAKIKLVNILRRKMDFWVENQAFIFLLKFTDNRYITKFFFAIGLPIFCVEIFPHDRKKVIAYKKRFVQESFGVIYLLGTNNLLTDDELEVIESL